MALNETDIRTALMDCYDPEIPVNIVDLGLIYEMKVLPLDGGMSRIEVKMTLTAQGCGMGTSIASDAQYKLLDLPGVKEADVATPARGMTMDQVASKFGAPANKVPAVGKPPISRWEYPGFVVYFEANHVIHSVVANS